MSSVFARLRAALHGGCSSSYGLVATLVTVLLFCALAAAVSVWKAFAFAGLALVVFGVADCLWCAGRRGAGAAVDTAAGGVPLGGCRFGLGKAAIDALPTFAYCASRGAVQNGDIEAGDGAGREPCSVCLEDVHEGEVVRQLPACKHLFHVGCIDMWLHSHRTCPLCRCDLSRPRRIAAKAVAVEAAVEAEPPADEALPPV